MKDVAETNETCDAYTSGSDIKSVEQTSQFSQKEKENKAFCNVADTIEKSGNKIDKTAEDEGKETEGQKKQETVKEVAETGLQTTNEIGDTNTSENSLTSVEQKGQSSQKEDLDDGIEKREDKIDKTSENEDKETKEQGKQEAIKEVVSAVAKEKEGETNKTSEKVVKATKEQEQHNTAKEVTKTDGIETKEDKIDKTSENAGKETKGQEKREAMKPVVETEAKEKEGKTDKASEKFLKLFSEKQHANAMKEVTKTVLGEGNEEYDANTCAISVKPKSQVSNEEIKSNQTSSTNITADIPTTTTNAITITTATVTATIITTQTAIATVTATATATVASSTTDNATDTGISTTTTTTATVTTTTTTTIVTVASTSTTATTTISSITITTTTTATATATTATSTIAPKIIRCDEPTAVLSPGTFIQIHGLTSNAGKKYNGELAMIEEFIKEQKRYKVRLCDVEKQLKVRPKNIKDPETPNSMLSSIIAIADTVKQQDLDALKAKEKNETSSTTVAAVAATDTATPSILATVEDQSEENLFLSSERKKKIISHMNKDHSESLKAYLHFFNNMVHAASATMIDVDSEGMVVNVMLEDGSLTNDVRINFLRQLNDPKDIRKMTVEMHKMAFKHLGWKSDTPDHSNSSIDHSQPGPDHHGRKTDKHHASGKFLKHHWKKIAIGAGAIVGLALILNINRIDINEEESEVSK